MGINVKKLKGLDDFKRTLENLKKPMDQPTAEAIGTAVVAEMKRMILAGVSPIASVGPFPRYKNPKRYPADKKPKTPVNLTLTGAFLNDLTFKLVDSDAGKAPRIGYYSPKQEIKEQGHREGANGQPLRPTVPLVRHGEEFAASINRAISRIFKARIKQITSGKG